MKKATVWCLVLGVALMMAGCAAPHKPFAPFEPTDLTARWNSGGYALKADNYLILLDASSSMTEVQDEHEKFKTAGEIIHRMNRTLPPVDMQGAMRSFGHHASVSKAHTMLVVPFGPHSREALDAGVDKVARAGGGSPISEALGAARSDLAGVDGRTALLLISDGEDMGDAAVSVAGALKAAYGDRLCLYTIHVGNDRKGADLLKRIADAGGCGFAVEAADIMSGAAMANYVERVFLTRQAAAAPAAPLDSDGDGVVNADDRCPGTPAGVAVDNAGCPLDSDGDGVTDNLDQCPDTPRGTAVDADGCPLDADGDGVLDDSDQCPDTPAGAEVNSVGCWVLSGVQFDSGRWNIKPSASATLDEVVTVLKANPGLKVEIQGHTDSVGNDAYNMDLSEKRARAVKEYLTGHGIAANRVSSAGYGETQPIYSNDTADGRAGNRRVQIMPIP